MVFHDRRLQYTEHQQLEGWKWNRPGDRLLDIGNDAWLEMFTQTVSCDLAGVHICLCLCGADIPMSVGIIEPKTHPSQLNAAEFLWDLNKRTSVFVQVKTHLIYCHWSSVF